MHLTDADIGYLRWRLGARERMRRLGTIVLGLDVVVAVALFLFLDSPTNYLIAAVMVVSGVTVVYVLRMTADRMGDAQSILDGRQPTAWTQVVAVDDEGDAPRPWSLELTDQPGTYLHVGGTQKTQWRFERGETYLVHGFGPADNPYAGIVFFVRPHQRERSWHHAAPSTKRRYLSRTD